MLKEFKDYKTMIMQDETIPVEDKKKLIKEFQKKMYKERYREKISTYKKEYYRKQVNKGIHTYNPEYQKRYSSFNRGRNSHKKWSQEDDTFLMNNKPTMTYKEIAIELDRSLESVKQRYKTLTRK